MGRKILSIHHVTAIAGDPQATSISISGMLGLRLIKLTVTFDEPGTYHLYYGDGIGTPGTIITFPRSQRLHEGGPARDRSQRRRPWLQP